jgi:hypothetical protein
MDKYSIVSIDSSLSAPAFYFEEANEWFVFVKKNLSQVNKDFIKELNHLNNIKINYLHTFEG